MKLKLTAEEVIPILKRIEESGQIIPEWFWTLTPREIAHCYNGVGSDLTWKPLRKALSFIFRWAIRAVVIHDTIWTYIERFELTDEDFYESNQALKMNARIELLEHTSKWWNPILYWYRYRNAWLAEKACNNLGKQAWDN